MITVIVIGENILCGDNGEIFHYFANDIFQILTPRKVEIQAFC